MTHVPEEMTSGRGASGCPEVPVVAGRGSVTVTRRGSSRAGLPGTGARALPAAACTLLAFGLFVLAGVTTDAGTALAQDECQLAPGVTPPPGPSVTAQDVEDGSATLMEFVQAATGLFKTRATGTLSSDRLAYAGCELRRDDGPFRSGSTYVVTLTFDGRVFFHGKDMSLSAASLKPAIYGGILSALGVPRPVLLGLASGDPDARRRARAELLQRLRSEPHAPFDLTGAGIPGASGYAAAYVTGNSVQPNVLLAGFDLEASHVADEELDYGSPAITAAEVVDRETLKKFVEEAARFLAVTQRNAGAAAEIRVAMSKARLALRDPDGPWRHGSVYLYVLDQVSNVILIHGAFPDRFELKPLVPTVRDVVTGELVLPQVIDAAKSSPDGGFLEYYWDDPGDDTDRADIPKLGYAREFTRTITTRTGEELKTSLIIGSGVYLPAPEPTDPGTDSAQGEDECPLPPGVTPPPEPPVTAQAVVDGSATLMELVQAATAQFKRRASQTVTQDQLAYGGCLLRREDGPWRSGSTYLVTLTFDGRVFFHGADMSLSAASLKPAIYGGILSALGVPRPVLLGLASQDPDTRATARATLLQVLRSEPHAPFDLTGAPAGIPGASGYAGAYVTGNSVQPNVLLAGFDLDASHLADEEIDYGSPAITAEEVVDRETLKKFVEEAARFLAVTQRSAGSAAEARVAMSKARLALRDPDGPWRHGSVYLYVLDLASNVILIHGAFPDRFELKPLVPTVRDVVTGELVLPQVIDAAKSGPEGGFLEYYWDDPGDDTDRADIPKLGYAREFTRTITTRTGEELKTSLIIGSGVYLREPETTAAGQNAAVEAVLPQMMRAMTASTVDALSSRIQQATSETPPSRELSLAGGSTLPDALLANRHALESGSLDLGRLLAGSSFTLALDAADTGGSGLIGNLTFWGSGDYRNFSGGNQEAVAYDGSVMSANLGVDAKVGAEVLAGVAVAQARGTADYTDAGAVSGELTTTVTSINPYVGWQATGGMNLWATVGYGSGEVEVEVDDSTGTQASDLTQQTAAAGVSGPLVASDRLIAGGTTSLRVKGETAFTRAELDGSEALESMTANASRHRLMLEGSHVQDLASGATFTPSVEVGVRSDGGDGDTGTSVEAGGGVRYADQASGLTVEARARTLLAHSGDYEEWGVSGLIRIDPGPAGQGLALSVRPAWGQTASGVHRLWQAGVTGGAAPAGQANGRLDARVSYGMALFGGHFLGTPEAGLGLSEVGHEWQLGWRLQLARNQRVSLNLGLEATRWEPADAARAPEDRVGLNATVLW